MTTGIVIQARTGSTRMPNKSILPFFQNKSITEIIIERLLLETKDIPIILATTKSKNDNPLVELSKKLKINYFRGETENVLKRFIDCSDHYSLDSIIRICADNPFMDVSSINNLIAKNESRVADYAAYSLHNGTPTIKTHYGLWAEMVNLKSLKRIQQLTTEKKYLEHVTNYIYDHPVDFDIQLIHIPEEVQAETDIRLTIDTMIDFNSLSKLYIDIIHNNIPFTSKEIVNFLKTNNEIKLIMKNQIINNSK